MELKNHYFLRKVDELGRIVLPLEVRRELDIKEAETMKVTIVNGKIVLDKNVNYK